MGKQLANAELVALWFGDREVMGYQHERLVEELCRRLKPANPLACLKLLYPDVCNLNDAENMVELDARRIIDRGFLKWHDPEQYARRYWKPGFGSG